jgi:hypothetical protein
VDDAAGALARSREFREGISFDFHDGGGDDPQANGDSLTCLSNLLLERDLGRRGGRVSPGSLRTTAGDDRASDEAADQETRITHDVRRLRVVARGIGFREEIAARYPTFLDMWLLLIALFGLVVPNGFFVYWLLFEYQGVSAVLADKLAVGFMLDVVVALILLSAYFARHPLGPVKWYWFVVLSFIGGLGFSLPLYYWLNRRPTRLTA